VIVIPSTTRALLRDNSLENLCLFGETEWGVLDGYELK